MKQDTIAWWARILSSAATAQVGLMVSCGGPTSSGGFGGDGDSGPNTDSGSYSGSSTGSGSGSPNGGSGSGGGNASSGGSGSTSSGSGSGGASTGSSSGSGSSAGGGSGGTGSSGGSGSTSGSSGGSSGSSAGASGGPSPTKLPTVSGTCPTFQTGNVTVTAGASSIQAQIWMGSAAHQGGMLILYWHGTGSSANSEVPMAFDTNAVTSAGGVIVGFNANTRTGTPTATTGNNVWYQSDAAFADQVVACAIQQLATDARRIHAAGYSAGGLQTVYMWFARSGYIASVISYSGGDATINKVAMQDATNLPGAIASHGAMGSDVVIVDFANTSATWESEIKTAGGFSIDCNDGGNHTDFFTKRAPGIKPAAVKFFLDHPFKVNPEPYSVLPSGFPSYCKIN